MKLRKVFLSAAISATVLLTGCGPITEEVSVNFAETYTASNEKLASYTDLVWESADTAIVEVNGSEMLGLAPGSTIVTAKSGDSIVAEYTVTVNIVPVTGIVLSTNSTELVEGDALKVTYTLFPDNASDFGIQWRSADESVATVTTEGEILALKMGQTTITASTKDGIIATCSVNVKQKAAYDRLSDAERTFVNEVLEHISDFKNPDSVVIKAVEKDGTQWVVTVSAQNGFGGMNSTNYYLSDDLGFWNWDALDIELDVDITPDSSYNISLINEAIAEKR